MNKKKKFAFLSVAVAAAMSSSIICGSFANMTVYSKGGEKVTIRLAHTYTGSDAKAPLFASMLKKFKSQHPDINVVEETASGDDMRTKIKVDMASNSLPDVFTYWGGSILKPLVDNNKVLDISKYLKKSKKLKKSDISSGAWSFYTYNGTTYGIPMEGYVSAFVVNKDLFKKYNVKYPKTEKDLLAVAKVFNKNGIVPLAMGSKGGNPSHFYFSELYNQLPNGTKEIENLGTSYKFNTANALKVTKIINEQRLGGVYPKDTVANGDWTPTYQLYQNGKAAMLYTYPWVLGQFSRELAAKSAIIPVPMIPGATKNPSTFVSGSAVFGFCISKDSFNDSKKQAAIVELADFMTSDEMFQQLSKGGLVPTKKVKIDRSKLAPMLKAALDYSDDLEKVPDHFNTWPDDNSFTTFQSSLDELFAGGLTPQKFVDKVQADLTKGKKK